MVSKLISIALNSRTYFFFVDDSQIFIKVGDKDFQALKRVLKHYEEVSGQTINLEKSAFMMSRNMSRETKEECEKILGVKRTDSLGVYLGMPSQIGKNKRIAFSRIKGRVEKLLQWWKEKLFSLGGKEVLIKSVAQAVPTYTISCFRQAMGEVLVGGNRRQRKDALDELEKNVYR